MTVVVALLTAVLMIIALLHLAWGLGLRWPVADEARLAATVIGIRGQTRMPTLIPCLVVSLGLMALVALVFRHVLAPGRLSQSAMVAAAAVFLTRGLLAWLPVWRRLTPQQPFARLDQVLYGPLCLLLSAGLAAVALGWVR